jgi:deoxyribodipyrimidine photo-lyase
MKIALHWFRADLRLSDNTALHAAVADSEGVVPVFIFDPRILKSPDTGSPIVGFMLACLESLEKNIEAAGGKLIFRHGPVEEVMPALWRETGATALYFNRDYEPVARERDASMEKLARAMGLEVHSYKDGMLHEPDEVLKEDGQPYRVFTPYARAWRMKPKAEVLPAVKFKRPAGFEYPPSLSLPTARDLGFAVEVPLPPAGERAARDVATFRRRTGRRAFRPIYAWEPYRRAPSSPLRPRRPRFIPRPKRKRQSSRPNSSGATFTARFSGIIRTWRRAASGKTTPI